MSKLTTNLCSCFTRCSRRSVSILTHFSMQTDLHPEKARNRIFQSAIAVAFPICSRRSMTAWYHAEKQTLLSCTDEGILRFHLIGIRFSVKKPFPYDVLEQLHNNRPVINGFQQNGSTFSYLLIVSAKYDMGQEPV